VNQGAHQSPPSRNLSRTGLSRACVVTCSCVFAWLCLFATAPIEAHELQPCVLNVDATGDTTLEVSWIAPIDVAHPLEIADEPTQSLATGRSIRDIRPTFPDDCRVTTPALQTYRGSTRRWTWTMECTPEAIAALRIEVTGLETATSDVIVRYMSGDGVMRTTTLRAGHASVTWELSDAHVWTARWGVAVTYILLGIEHILLGPDHLIFVLLLLLLVADMRALLATITGFTIGHSLTLVLAVTDVVHVPGPPVEALIALSIVQLAVAVVRDRPESPSAMARRPWVISSVFGLLHGLGFAGALAETGLPSSGLAVALATFNVGVELGQLLFVAAVLAVMWAVPSQFRRDVRWGLAYIAGAVAAYWLVERSVALVTG
jgi:hydrogenase/urease accessory protein HupE